MEAKAELRKVKCAQRTLEYLLTRKPVKNINLRIKLEGVVRVSANPKVPAKYIDEFVKSKESYIITALDQYERSRQSMQAPKKYVSGENFDILGQSLQLQVMQGKEEFVTTDGIFIFLTVKDKENQQRKKRVMDQWLKEIQITIFHEVCEEVYKIFKQYDVEYPSIKIRTMTSRWGSCQPQRGIITLNSRLIEVSKSIIEYVVVHEFSHFIHPNHSKKFYEFLTILMPDWKERKKELEKWQ